jgi:hypothetical protein
MVYDTYEEIEFAEFAAVIDDTKIYEHSIAVIVDFVAFASSECAGLDVAVTPVLIDKDRKIRFLEDVDGIDCSKMSRSLTDELLISALNVIILARYGFGVSEKSVNHLIREEHFIRVTELTKDWEKFGERVPSSGFFAAMGVNPR